VGGFDPKQYLYKPFKYMMAGWIWSGIWNAILWRKTLGVIY